ncbi:hypothetical protein AAG906_020020 [Vitis piasezkii]
MPKTRGGHTSAPQSSERAALADTIRGEHLPHLWPLLDSTSAGESSRAPRDSQPQPPSTRRPRPSSPIEGNSDCRSKAFHVEAYFDHTILRQQTDLRDSYSLLERYHLVPFMTPPQFFYPRVVLDFTAYDYSWSPYHLDTFTIDGRLSILGLDRLPRLSISLMHQLIPLHLDVGPHFLSGTWFVAYLKGHLPEDHFQEGASRGCSS